MWIGNAVAGAFKRKVRELATRAVCPYENRWASRYTHIDATTFQ